MNQRLSQIMDWLKVELTDLALGHYDDEIAITWHIDDVRAMRPDLSRRQARTVLKAVERDYQPEIGVNRRIVLIAAHRLYPSLSPADKDQALPLCRSSWNGNRSSSS